jgi:hypothetical protein
MRRELVGILGLLLLVSSLAYAAENRGDVDNKGGAVDSSTNRVLKAEGFMKKTKIIQTDVATAAKLSAVTSKMKVLRKPKEGQVDIAKGPQTIDEAAEYLRKHVSMAYPPSVCTEYEGMFYFSGGKSTEAVVDFSSGFAIKKGEAGVLSWDKGEQ